MDERIHYECEMYLENSPVKHLTTIGMQKKTLAITRFNGFREIHLAARKSKISDNPFLAKC